MILPLPLRKRLGALAVCALVGCAARPVSLPAVVSPPTERHRAGEFVWFDLLADEPEPARAFYGGLFGWTFEPLADGTFDTIVHRGRPIGGIIRHHPENDRSPDDIWLPSLSVDDVDRAAQAARAAGGKIVRAPRNVGARGRVAVLRDPEGAALAVMRSAGGDPAPTPPASGDFVWVQLWARDHEMARAFYEKVGGWTVRRFVAHDGIDEGVFEAGGEEVAGLIEIPWPKVRPNWLPYVQVADVDATIARATELGGRVLVRGARLAILQDPRGAAIGVEQMSTAQEPSR